MGEIARQQMGTAASHSRAENGPILARHSTDRAWDCLPELPRIGYSHPEIFSFPRPVFFAPIRENVLQSRIVILFEFGQAGFRIQFGRIHRCRFQQNALCRRFDNENILPAERKTSAYRTGKRDGAAGTDFNCGGFHRSAESQKYSNSARCLSHVFIIMMRSVVSPPCGHPDPDRGGSGEGRKRPRPHGPGYGNALRSLSCSFVIPHSTFPRSRSLPRHCFKTLLNI